jgi:hypothetical protein
MTGSLIGLVLALAGRVVITSTVYDSTNANGWSWVVVAILGMMVGGGCALFIYGGATDRDDAADATAGGQADVGERGEWRRTLDRRRRRRTRVGT